MNIQVKARRTNVKWCEPVDSPKKEAACGDGSAVRHGKNTRNTHTRGEVETINLSPPQVAALLSAGIDEESRFVALTIGIDHNYPFMTNFHML